MKKNPVFIGGLMKSGTSLIRSLIGNHSNIFGGLETWWFSEDFQNDYKLLDSKTAQKLQTLYGVNEKVYAELVLKSEHHLSFLNLFLLYNATREGKIRWVEKTPDNIFHLDQLNNFWDNNYLFIYMMRDPFDTFASWKKNTSHSLDLFEKKTHDTVEILSSDDFSKSENHVLITYEDLILRTKDVMKKVITFIGESWENGIEMNKKDRTEYNLVKKFANKNSTTLESLSKPIFTSSIHQYGEILNQKEIEKIKWFAKDYIKIFQAALLSEA